MMLRGVWTGGGGCVAEQYGTGLVPGASAARGRVDGVFLEQFSRSVGAGSRAAGLAGVVLYGRSARVFLYVVVRQLLLHAGRGASRLGDAVMMFFVSVQWWFYGYVAEVVAARIRAH